MRICRGRAVYQSQYWRYRDGFRGADHGGWMSKMRIDKNQTNFDNVLQYPWVPPPSRWDDSWAHAGSGEVKKAVWPTGYTALKSGNNSAGRANNANLGMELVRTNYPSSDKDEDGSTVTYGDGDTIPAGKEVGDEIPESAR